MDDYFSISCENEQLDGCKDNKSFTLNDILDIV